MEKCGCKGIRTCLLCENIKGSASKISNELELISYSYCHHCKLCWPTDAQLNEGSSPLPLVLNGICLLPEFVSRDEEDDAVSKIDSIPWMTSQSGRRKQDFGPKVNFKKRKLKSGNFQGFPKFAHQIADKFKDVGPLFSFRPVELCHLEYCPERGSSIDPHLDDCWLWGERLVTVNILSETTLILTPAKLESSDNYNCCNFKNFAKSTSCKLPLVRLSNLEEVRFAESASEAQFSDAQSAVNTCALPNGTCSTDRSDAPTCDHHSPFNSSLLSSKRDIDLCCTSLLDGKVEVRITLPRRSLLVLWGCARHHWCHEIRRCDITSRRLAMTFRELSDEFLEGGDRWSIGEEMLTVAQKVID